MSSAEGILQQMRYTATFPLLLNISGEPTYFMAMKDNAGLVKQYAMVNVGQFTVVGIGDTIASCEQNYLEQMAAKGIAVDQGSRLETDVSGVISDIRSAVIDGNTHYYVRMEHSVGYLDFSAAEVPRAVLLDKGDQIWYSYVLEGAEFPENGIVHADGFWFDGETPPAETAENAA